jgi:hypothetical protein
MPKGAIDAPSCKETGVKARTTARLAWSLCGVSLALLALSILLILLSRTATFPPSPVDWTAASWAEQLAGVVGLLGARSLAP